MRGGTSEKIFRKSLWMTSQQWTENNHEKRKRTLRASLSATVEVTERVLRLVQRSNTSTSLKISTRAVRWVSWAARDLSKPMAAGTRTCLPKLSSRKESSLRLCGMQMR
jgi:hypothetical protein